MRRLARQTYARTHRFIVLPSQRAARWLLPQGENRRSLQGLQIYTPYASTARIAKALLGQVLRTGFERWARHQLLIASREPLPLEALVSEVTGEHQPVFALSVGTPGRFRKLAMQVMRPSGEALGYIKLPLSEAATERVRHEAEVLKRLGKFASLRSRIPKVLHDGEWGVGHILFQSRGPASAGPAEFGPLHQEFLRTLRSLGQVGKPGAILVEEVAASWRKAAPFMDSRLRALGERALALAGRDLDAIAVPCGIMHGDFAPWNTRVENGYLYVFDWESAAWEAPILWDTFHFQVQVASLLGKRRRGHLLPGGTPGDRACFWLYVLSSLCQLLEEGVSGDHPGIRYRRHLLAEQLH